MNWKLMLLHETIITFRWPDGSSTSSAGLNLGRSPLSTIRELGSGRWDGIFFNTPPNGWPHAYIIKPMEVRS